MGNVFYLCPYLGDSAAARLHANVETAILKGRRMGDRRSVLRDIMSSLRVKQHHLRETIDAAHAARHCPDEKLRRLAVDIEQLAERILADTDAAIDRILEHLAGDAEDRQRRH